MTDLRITGDPDQLRELRDTLRWLRAGLGTANPRRDHLTALIDAIDHAGDQP